MPWTKSVSQAFSMLSTSLHLLNSHTHIKHLLKAHFLSRLWHPTNVVFFGAVHRFSNNNIIMLTIFILLSSWHSHCESSPGLFDECRLSAGWPPILRPNQPISAVSPPKDCTRTTVRRPTTKPPRPAQIWTKTVMFVYGTGLKFCTSAVVATAPSQSCWSGLSER